MSEIEAFAGLVDLANENVGGQALLCSDDFFAGMENLLKRGPARFDPATYTERGKEMDGWESRRKRVPGHDWCIIRLGVPGRLRGVDIDTSFFLGNHPPFASLDAACLPADTTPEALRDTVQWTRILDSVPLKRGSHNLHPIAEVGGAEQGNGHFTHVRLNIYPDGGVARLRVYGEPRPTLPAGEIDLASIVNGGKALACSDMFFSPMNNLILPGRSTYMGGGWETRRSRPPGEDWIILALCAPGRLRAITLDTGFFKGNFPDSAQVEGLFWPGAPAQALIGHPSWRAITSRVSLRADVERNVEVTDPGPLSHLRLRIFPDGGVARLRAWGQPTQDLPADPLVAFLNGQDTAALRVDLARCCGSSRWVERMLAARPFLSRDHLFGTADQIWWHLGDGDWKEAFTHHPQIGADLASLQARFPNTAGWSAGEQAGVVQAHHVVLQALAEGNAAYLDRFGHIFIVCASGLTAETMVERLRERFDNSPANELRIAAGEQAKITRLRLDRLTPTPEEVR
jgi:allantoicase